MVIFSQENMGTIPFKKVYIQFLKIMDGQGRTMSKSLGNGVDPLDIEEKIRYRMCSSLCDGKPMHRQSRRSFTC